MADNNLVADESEVSDIESAKFIKKTGKILYSPIRYDSKQYDEEKCNNTVKILFIAIICLSFGLLAGGYLQKVFHFYSDTDSYSMTTTLPIQASSDREITEFGIFGGNKNKGRKKKGAARKNEAECASRRCCNIRDGLTQRDLPNNLKCKKLSDEECGEMDEFCEWDCESPINHQKKQKRRYRGISLFGGNLQEPTEEISNDIGGESYEECLEDGKVIEVDECGVEYEVELDPNELKTFCKLLRKKKNASFKNGKTFLGNAKDDESKSRRLSVLGADGRKELTSSDFPASAVFFLMFKKPDNSFFSFSRCTATMISPRWAITAAHCLWGDGDWYSDFELYRNIESCLEIEFSFLLGNKFNINKKVIFTSYRNNQAIGNDIGLLRLTEDPGEGYFDFGYNSDFSGSQVFTMISHPGDKSDCSKWVQTCPYNGWSNNEMTTEECDTFGGASGTSVWKQYWTNIGDNNLIFPYLIDINLIIFGIHSSAGSTKNYAARITSGRYNTICNYIEAQSPNHCDMVHDAQHFS